MKKKFEVLYSEKAIEFLEKLEDKSRQKIIYNIDKATFVNDSELFKKLNDEIWEFRTLYNKQYYRLLSFWDKEGDEKTLVIVSHGFIKKTDKIPKSEIEKAEKYRYSYFEQKKNK